MARVVFLSVLCVLTLPSCRLFGGGKYHSSEVCEHIAGIVNTDERLVFAQARIDACVSEAEALRALDIHAWNVLASCVVRADSMHGLALCNFFHEE